MNSARRTYQLLDRAQKKRIISNLRAERDKLKSNSVFSHIGLGPENPSPRLTQPKDTDPTVRLDPTSLDCRSDKQSNKVVDLTDPKFEYLDNITGDAGHTTFGDQNFPSPDIQTTN